MGDEPMEETARLSELAESDATGETRDVFEQIKTLSGVPMVALIYRHMATLPGVLEWAWQVLSPVMVTGRLQEVAWDIADAVTLPAVLPIPLIARQAAGISQDEDAAIANILDAFNRTNPVNAVALKYLERHLGAPEVALSTSSDAARSWRPPAMLPALPPMLDVDEIERPALEIISWLSRRDGSRYAGIWPSLYRYLAREPTFLAFAAIILPPHFASIDTATQQIKQRITSAASSLPLQSAVRPEELTESSTTRIALKRAMTEFSTLIPEMLVVGSVLRRALADAQ
jgi:hypothetical protein